MGPTSSYNFMHLPLLMLSQAPSHTTEIHVFAPESLLSFWEDYSDPWVASSAIVTRLLKLEAKLIPRGRSWPWTPHPHQPQPSRFSVAKSGVSRQILFSLHIYWVWPTATFHLCKTCTQNNTTEVEKQGKIHTHIYTTLHTLERHDCVCIVSLDLMCVHVHKLGDKLTLPHSQMMLVESFEFKVKAHHGLAWMKSDTLVWHLRSCTTWWRS